jgi:oligopeptide transport system substrate-binding protein
MLRILLIPVLLLGLLAGSMIWSGETTASRADFAFVNRGDPLTLDLNNMAWAQDIRLASALWEGLYMLPPTGGEPVFGCADDMKVSADQRVYTVHIRPEARWTNGDPLLADDFLFEWRRMLESPREYTYLHHYIKGAKAYEDAYAKYAEADLKHKPPLPDFGTVGEEKLDDKTLRITLTDPVPFFPSLLAFACFYPMHEPSMRKFLTPPDPVTGAQSYREEFTQPPNLVTNGPYRMAEWQFKRRIRLIASDYYWNRSAVKSRVIDEICVADNPMAAYRLYQQGDVDWLVDVDGEAASALLKNPARTDLHIFPGFGTYFYEFNCQPKLNDGTDNPLMDVRVRQALAMAINKQPIVDNVAKMQQPVATTYIPLGAFAGYHSPPGLAYDVEAARRLLADAGYPGGKGFPRISILFNTDGIHGDVATIIRRQWADALGISVDPRSEELSQFKNDLHNHNFIVSRASWSGDYNDPSTFTDKYLSTSENNAAGWVDKPYDALCAAAAVEPNPVKRFALLSHAEDRLLSQAPIAPIFTNVNAYLFHNNVRGIALNALQAQPFGAIQVENSKNEIRMTKQ